MTCHARLLSSGACQATAWGSLALLTTQNAKSFPAFFSLPPHLRRDRGRREGREVVGRPVGKGGRWGRRSKACVLERIRRAGLQVP